MGKLNRVLSACGFGTLLLASSLANAGVVLNEGFDGSGIPAGWLVTPAVTVTAPVNWQKPIEVGPNGEFAAQSGAPDSYLFNSYNSTPTSVGGISDLLITPLLTVNNGTVLSFYVKADPLGESSFPDRLQVLFSTGGTSTASFTRLLLDINPTYSPTDFPTDWSLRTVTLTGLSGPTTARFAFDYLLTNVNNPAYPNGTQGNYIGLDSVTVTVPEPDTALLLAIGVVGLGLGARRARSGKVHAS